MATNREFYLKASTEKPVLYTIGCPEPFSVRSRTSVYMEFQATEEEMAGVEMREFREKYHLTWEPTPAFYDHPGLQILRGITVLKLLGPMMHDLSYVLQMPIS